MSDVGLLYTIAQLWKFEYLMHRCRLGLCFRGASSVPRPEPIGVAKILQWRGFAWWGPGQGSGGQKSCGNLRFNEYRVVSIFCKHTSQKICWRFNLQAFFGYDSARTPSIAVKRSQGWRRTSWRRCNWKGSDHHRRRCRHRPVHL